eukprot:Phypoly_transcript_04212.p1 GENE.Phypoly_transcript_04212~~Phypoly_transcript_04212.p1  ORF type:complete len:681 (+),score=92.68 Phypoly_transcript_04212:118-2160(+)
MRGHAIVFLVLVLVGASWCELTPYQRAVALCANMTFKEKIDMVHGHLVIPPLTYVGQIPINKRLNIPAINMEDGPQGVGDLQKGVTCWPSALTAAATWDTNLVNEYYKAIGNEMRGKGVNIMLGPMVNIARVPMSGRTYEGFGEDPYLVSKMAEASITGIQSQGVIATVKHWVNNNQEYDRTKVSANVDERTEWEIYYPAFQAAVNAGAGSVMCAYNRVNNVYSCENEETIVRDLKGKMGYQGFVVSDWLATHSTVDSANNGLDIEMPGDRYFGVALEIEIELGNVNRSQLDEMVTRILYSMFAGGLMDTPQTGDLKANVTNWNHSLLARQVAAEATVLLQNTDNLLPLNINNLKTIAVIGDDASDNPIFHGTGSGMVENEYLVTPLEGIQARAGPSVSVTYANSNSIIAAAQAAQAADVAIVFVSVEAGEGHDRANLSLTGNQDQLVAAVAKVQENTIVVLHVPGAVLMQDWIDSVKSVLCAFYPGQEDGNAIAEVIFGDVNPSARLPMTFPQIETQIPLNTTIQYPGINYETNYTEKLEVGYRWYDANDQTPLFAFGHGLSYTNFTYSDLAVAGAATSYTVKFNLTNSGKVAGAEIPQLYLWFPKSAGEPPQALKGFQKVFMQPGETAQIVFTLEQQDFSIWDITTHNYVVVDGEFWISVGPSSRDRRLNANFIVSSE